MNAMSYFDRLLDDDQTLHYEPLVRDSSLAGRYSSLMNILVEVDPEAANGHPDDTEFHRLPLDTQRAILGTIGVELDAAIAELTDGVWRFSPAQDLIVRPADI